MSPTRRIPRDEWEAVLRSYNCQPLSGKGPLNTAEYWQMPFQHYPFNVPNMADVIIGAAAAKRNEVNHTSAKGALADFVLARSGLGTWHRSTPSGARFLTVWNHLGRGGPS